VSDKAYFAHETAVVDDGARIGAGTKIWHFSHIMSGARIGENCNFGQNVVVSSKAVVGNGCKVQNNVSIYDRVTLEDHVFCGPSMVFTNVFNPRAHISRKHEYLETLIRTGATIGANAVIVCGNTLGRYAFVGSGAVVNRDVPDFALVVGNPIRRAGWMCQCGIRIEFGDDNTATCSACQWQYVLEDGLCRETHTGGNP
jgi:UDP-2-acetamido-3-amino-2,3-dideoxy-glucuronate N-acetyltransferase